VASRGYIDDVIEPTETRSNLIKALSILQNKENSNPEEKQRITKYEEKTKS